MQLRILFDRKLAAGEYDDRHIRQGIVAPDTIEHLEAAHVR
jgi:hypothetical protein